MFEVCLQVTAGHAERADRTQRAGHRELVQQLVHQDAGSAARLQLQPRPVKRAEVPLLEEAAQAAGAERVAARRIQRLHQRLQADVAHQVIVHLQPVVVEMVLPGAVDLTTLWTESLGSWLHGPRDVHLTAGAAHLLSFGTAQVLAQRIQLCGGQGLRTHLSHKLHGLNRLQRTNAPQWLMTHLPGGQRAQRDGLTAVSEKSKQVSSVVAHAIIWQMLHARVPMGLHDTNDSTVYITVAGPCGCQ